MDKASNIPLPSEKKPCTETVTSLTCCDNSIEGGTAVEEAKSQWQPGFASRFPWLGLGALLFVLLCVGGNVAILLISNGKRQGDQSWKQIRQEGLSDWPKQIRSSVCFTILNNLADLAFGLAIANGVAIAWWRQALKGSTIQKLHDSWRLSTSVQAIALAGTSFNLIALAALVAKFIFIDGVLMQAPTITMIVADQPTNSTLRTWSNSTIPTTAIMSLEEDPDTSMSYDKYQLKDYFVDELVIWAQNPSNLPSIGIEGCSNATCFTNVLGAGFEFDCTAVHETDVDWVKALTPNSEPNTNATTFDISFTLDFDLESPSPDPVSGIVMNVTHSQSTTKTSTCPGIIHHQTCTLRPAVVSYPVMVQNYGALLGGQIMSLATSTSNEMNMPLAFSIESRQQEGFRIDHLVQIRESLYSDVRLRGLQQAFTQYFPGHADLVYKPTRGYHTTATGSDQTYLLKTGEGEQGCDFVFNDPMEPNIERRNTQSLVAMINQIMFSLSMDISNTDPYTKHTYTEVPAIIYTESIHFRTRYLFMIGAVISTTICVMCVLPTYWGYWQIGRKVSLGPFEIAHAFRSPMTAQAENGSIEQVIDRVGHREVQYGHIVYGDARGILGVAEPEYVANMTASAKSELRDKILRRGAAK